MPPPIKCPHGPSLERCDPCRRKREAQLKRRLYYQRTALEKKPHAGQKRYGPEEIKFSRENRALRARIQELEAHIEALELALDVKSP
jgi:hypothetical protein